MRTCINALCDGCGHRTGRERAQWISRSWCRICGTTFLGHGKCQDGVSAARARHEKTCNVVRYVGGASEDGFRSAPESDL